MKNVASVTSLQLQYYTKPSPVIFVYYIVGLFMWAQFVITISLNPDSDSTAVGVAVIQAKSFEIKQSLLWTAVKTD